MTTIERTPTSQVAEYMRRPYLMELAQDDDYCAATFPELPGLMAAADTWDELERKIADAKVSYFMAAIEASLPIPEPGDSSEPASGRVLLRLPKTLHRQATRAAARDGVSVNTFLVSAVARELGRREPRHEAGERATKEQQQRDFKETLGVEH
jgi:antitoxin HicB